MFLVFNACLSIIYFSYTEVEYSGGRVEVQYITYLVK